MLAEHSAMLNRTSNLRHSQRDAPLECSDSARDPPNYSRRGTTEDAVVVVVGAHGDKQRWVSGSSYDELVEGSP